MKDVHDNIDGIKKKEKNCYIFELVLKVPMTNLELEKRRKKAIVAKEK